MCQRYVLPHQTTAEREFLPTTSWWKFEPKFNVAPTQYVPAIRLYAGQSEGVMLRWGLIPSWLKGAPTGSPLACVPSSRMERSPEYRAAWSSGQRCILPLAGYYVWQLTRQGYRQPFFVRLKDRSVFGVAAVWDRWVNEEDDVIESCALITLSANDPTAPIPVTGGIMPAILRRRDYQTWLRGTQSAARTALQVYKSAWMEAYPVSPRINASGVDDSALIHIAS